MSWEAAPLYVRTHDLARWLVERVESDPRWRGSTHGTRTEGQVLDLLEHVSLALTFPRTRRDHQRLADEAIVRLRVELRLAGELGRLSPGRLRYATGELGDIGRMLGGWRRSSRRREASA